MLSGKSTEMLSLQMWSLFCWKYKLNKSKVEGSLPCPLFYFIQGEPSFCSYSKVWCCFHYKFQFTWVYNIALRVQDGLQFPKQCQPRSKIWNGLSLIKFKGREIWHRRFLDCMPFFMIKYILITENMCGHIECSITSNFCLLCAAASLNMMLK